jgi:uncharacterized protein
MMTSFSWRYFSLYTAGMIALYWTVFILAAWVRGFVAHKHASQWFTKKIGIFGYFIGAGIGAITPFCSCTTIPVFLGLIESRVTLGYCISFLIASPLIDPPAVVLFLALFGLKLTCLYVILCMGISIIGGLVLGRKCFLPYVGGMFGSENQQECRFDFKSANTGYLHFLPKLIPVILIAATVATFLKGWIPPQGLFEYIGRHSALAIPTASVLGGAIYSEIGLLLPMGKLFMAKGLNEGIVFTFLMAAAGISIPSILLLSRIMRVPMLIVYVFTSLGLFTLCGYAISALKLLQWL